MKINFMMRVQTIGADAKSVELSFSSAKERGEFRKTLVPGNCRPSAEWTELVDLSAEEALHQLEIGLKLAKLPIV